MDAKWIDIANKLNDIPRDNKTTHNFIYETVKIKINYI